MLRIWGVRTWDKGGKCVFVLSFFLLIDATRSFNGIVLGFLLEG